MEREVYLEESISRVEFGGGVKDRGMVSDDSPSEVTSFNEMDDDDLIWLIQDPDASYEARQSALFELLKRAEENPYRDIAFQNLYDVKDFIQGEDQQFVLKALHHYADLGGNEAIVETFLDDESNALSVDRFRMLSYLDPANPLSVQSTGRLIDVFEDGQDEELRAPLINAIATAGGEEGMDWIMYSLDAGVEDETWEMMVKALSLSESPEVFDYMNKLLNKLVLEGSEVEPKREILRQIMLQRR